jgi:hypothetical protein
MPRGTLQFGIWHSCKCRLFIWHSGNDAFLFTDDWLIIIAKITFILNAMKGRKTFGHICRMMLKITLPIINQFTTSFYHYISVPKQILLKTKI